VKKYCFDLYGRIICLSVEISTDLLIFALIAKNIKKATTNIKTIIIYGIKMPLFYIKF